MNLRAVKGMNDFLPSDARQARRVEEAFRRTTEPGETVTTWFDSGAMFRAEGPQRGRCRQCQQVGAELDGERLEKVAA